MSATAHTVAELDLVTAQIGRAPREPWRVVSRCSYGYPNTVVSPSRLSDGTPFPTLAWLTCPWLTEEVAASESVGAAAAWTAKAADDQTLATRLRATDAAVRQARAVESQGDDACPSVGIAGQRDPLKVKCLHAHVALALLGIEDPIGHSVLEEKGSTCPDERCARLTQGATGE